MQLKICKRCCTGRSPVGSGSSKKGPTMIIWPMSVWKSEASRFEFKFEWKLLLDITHLPHGSKSVVSGCSLFKRDFYQISTETDLQRSSLEVLRKVCHHGKATIVRVYCHHAVSETRMNHLTTRVSGASLHL